MAVPMCSLCLGGLPPQHMFVVLLWLNVLVQPNLLPLDLAEPVDLSQQCWIQELITQECAGGDGASKV